MGICYTINYIELDDVVPYNYYNHYINPYILIYAFSEKMGGFFTMKMSKSNNWYEIYDQIKDENIYHLYNLPINVYRTQQKYHVRLTRPCFYLKKFVNTHKFTFNATRMTINDNSWRN